MSAASPLIDVVIPIFNVEKTIEQSIDSVLAQTFRAFNLIVVDDGSTDRSAHLVRSIAKRDSRVVLLSKENSGIVDALNMGISYSSAKYVARLDGDDIADPERLARQLAYLEGHPDCVAVSCNVRIIDQDGYPTGARTNFDQVDEADPYYAPSKEPYLSHPFLFVRRSALQAIGGYRHVFHAEDVDLYWRLQHIGRLHNISEVYGSYRVHAGSITSKSILNTKIASISAQLSAISEQRYREGKGELTFDKSSLSCLHIAEDLSKMIAIQRKFVSQKEFDYLKIATIAKVLHWLSFRKFRLSWRDCSFIGRSLASGTKSISKGNLDEVRKINVSVARLYFKDGAVFEAVLLLGPGSILSLINRKICRMIFRLRIGNESED